MAAIGGRGGRARAAGSQLPMSFTLRSTLECSLSPGGEGGNHESAGGISSGATVMLGELSDECWRLSGCHQKGGRDGLLPASQCAVAAVFRAHGLKFRLLACPLLTS